MKCEFYNKKTEPEKYCENFIYFEMGTLQNTDFKKICFWCKYGNIHEMKEKNTIFDKILSKLERFEEYFK